MNVVYDESTLQHFLSAATDVSPDHPVVISQFIDNAQEIDVDAVAHKGKLLVHAVSEHVENAGVHSGDATLVLPPFSLPESDMERFKVIAQKVAKAFEISGPFNMQIIRKPPVDGAEAELKVIECNLRASRSFPFVSKVLGKNFIDVASAAIMGKLIPPGVLYYTVVDNHRCQRSRANRSHGSEARLRSYQGPAILLDATPRC